MIFSSRVLIVGQRQEVIEDLIPLIKQAGHLALAVTSAEDALQAVETGPTPDIIISDLGDTPETDLPYLQRFQQISRLGRHLVITDSIGDQKSRASTDGALLVYPFRQEQIVEILGDLVSEIIRDLQSLRSEMLRESDALRHIVRETQRGVVAAMALTFETRDRFMDGHGRRVAELCREIGDEMDLSEEASEKLYSAALLHEIGRAGVPLDLLHKKGELTSQEKEQLAEYPRTSAMILQRISSLRPIAELVAHHTVEYEDLAKWIPAESEAFLLTSIMHVADAADAMSSERAYRSALPVEQRVRILEAGASKSFHPAVVRALIRIMLRRPNHPRWRGIAGAVTQMNQESRSSKRSGPKLVAA